jgi:chromate transporter
MSALPPIARLTLFLAAMSIISFGGVPPVLPDIRHYVVIANPWLSDGDFADFFALAQTIPGPNMIMMMGLIGWKVAGVPGAAAASGATAIPACSLYFLGYRLWSRYHAAAWQRVARASLVPLTCGLIVAGGTVMAETADKSWTAVAISAGAAALLLTTRLNPLWMIGGAALLGALRVV